MRLGVVMLVLTLSACRCGGETRPLLRSGTPVRADSAWEAMVVGWADRGERVERLEDAGATVRIRTAEGLVGWVPTRLLFVERATIAALVAPAPIFMDRSRRLTAMRQEGGLAFVLEEAGDLARVELPGGGECPGGICPGLLCWTLREALDSSERELAVARRYERVSTILEKGRPEPIAPLIHGADREAQGFVALERLATWRTGGAGPGSRAAGSVARVPAALAPPTTPVPEEIKPDASPPRPGAIVEGSPFLAEEVTQTVGEVFAPGTLVQVLEQDDRSLLVAAPGGQRGRLAPWSVSLHPSEVAVAEALAAQRQALAEGRTETAAEIASSAKAANPAARLLPLLDGQAVTPPRCPEHLWKREPGDASGRPPPAPPGNALGLSGRWGPQPTYDWATLAAKHLAGFDPDGPLSPSRRAEVRAQYRAHHLAPGDFGPGPVELEFDVPRSELRGSYHALGPYRIGALREAVLRGRVTFDVDADGCEVGQRTYSGHVKENAVSPGGGGTYTVAWLPPPASWASEVAIPEGPGGLELGADGLVLTLPGGEVARLAWAGERFRGHKPEWMIQARLGRLEPAGAHLLVIWWNEWGRGGFLVLQVVGPDLVVIGDEVNEDL